MQTAHTNQYQKKKKKVKKWEKYLNRHMSKDLRGLINTWIDAQHDLLLEKLKSKLQWDITSYQSERPSSKSLQTVNAGEGVEKREPSYTVGGNAN